MSTKQITVNNEIQFQFFFSIAHFTIHFANRRTSFDYLFRCVLLLLLLVDTTAATVVVVKCVCVLAWLYALCVYFVLNNISN